MGGHEPNVLEILERAEREHGPDDGGRIIVADDQPDERERLTALFQTLGYEVLPARSGAELEWLIDREVRHPVGRGGVEAVVTRARLPGSDGIAVVETLRQDDWHTPVILTTDDAGSHWDEAERLGAAAVLERPVRPLALIATLRALGAWPVEPEAPVPA